jgi:predicted nuclease of predicted toxin-antitoxin system
MIKILCDVHIAIKIAKFFSSKGIETEHVNQILEKWNTKDKDICLYADKYGFTVLTKDTDFKNSHFINHTPQKLIKVNLGNISTNRLIDIFDNLIDKLKELFGNNKMCYVEINPDNVVIVKSIEDNTN